MQMETALTKRPKRWLVEVLIRALPSNPDLMNEILDEVMR
jgi:hypothetical protein